MKHTLSYNRQLFNVKAIAAAGLLPEAIPEGEFAIVDEATNLTVLPADFAALPDNFRFISKLGGKVYYSFDCIDKTKILAQKAKEYQTETVNIWSGIIENCDCTKSVKLKVNIDEDSLIRRDGLTWTHSDFVVEVAPKELACLCDCSGKGVYENHVMTKLLYDKVQALNSPFYEAEVQDESGNVFADSAAIQTFIDAGKDDNTDDDDTNDTEKLVLFIKGKAQPAPNYRDLDVNYIYPRGAKLTVSATVNEYDNIAFTETQQLGFEIGAGYDLRAEEFECMNNYTDLNYYPQLSDGIASSELVYQIENNTNYDTVTFEFDSKKMERAGDGDMKRFIVCLASENGSGVHADLVSILNA